MKKIVILFLFFSCYTYSQEIEYIKTLDTIFVNFKEDSEQTKFVFPVDYIGFRERRFVINFLDNKKKEYFVFYFSEYPNSTRRDLSLIHI